MLVNNGLFKFIGIIKDFIFVHVITKFTSLFFRSVIISDFTENIMLLYYRYIQSSQDIPFKFVKSKRKF